ncbi:HPF/RaiA family ribosome-associated protein [Rivibacter subsaxonicus]|uniref:Sigma 54 modulation/S30EA-like ribosomal protein n=1 Tax=Rivibacter subsaxonicus TaxID=457575 RepID=A0A4Q7VGG2_9BURK|nr:HPF/RaiA family ribosome-associated protein [Rivibacter subsaxonicus]RZT95087.1 hypothetical protein EV670_2835 [Rivibacter subsaxonicus]
MRVQLNSSNGLNVPAEVRSSVDAMLRERLSRFGESFTRIEVHFHPGDPADHTGRDVRCGLEARAAGKRPLKVHHAAPGMEAAASRAADKLVTLVSRRVARKYTTSSKGHVRQAGGAEPAASAR